MQCGVVGAENGADASRDVVRLAGAAEPGSSADGAVTALALPYGHSERHVPPAERATMDASIVDAVVVPAPAEAPGVDGAAGPCLVFPAQKEKTPYAQGPRNIYIEGGRGHLKVLHDLPWPPMASHNLSDLPRPAMPSHALPRPFVTFHGRGHWQGVEVGGKTTVVLPPTAGLRELKTLIRKAFGRFPFHKLGRLMLVQGGAVSDIEVIVIRIAILIAILIVILMTASTPA